MKRLPASLNVTQFPAKLKGVDSQRELFAIRAEPNSVKTTSTRTTIPVQSGRSKDADQSGNRKVDLDALRALLPTPRIRPRVPTRGTEKYSSALPRPKGWHARCQRCGKEFYYPSPYVVIWVMERHILSEHALECAFCYFEGDSFLQLAEHVAEMHLSEKERLNCEYTKAKREERTQWEPGRETTQTGR